MVVPDFRFCQHNCVVTHRWLTPIYIIWISSFCRRMGHPREPFPCHITRKELAESAVESAKHSTACYNTTTGNESRYLDCKSFYAGLLKFRIVLHNRDMNPIQSALVRQLRRIVAMHQNSYEMGHNIHTARGKQFKIGQRNHIQKCLRL